jgi:hypothetical protein
MNVKIYCKPHVAKFINCFGDENTKKIVVDQSDNFLFSTIIRLYLMKKRYFYYNHSNHTLPENYTPVEIYINNNIITDSGMFFSPIDHKRLNKIIDRIFKEKLKSYVQAARQYSQKTLIEIVLDFLDIYDINDNEIIPESLVRYLFRQNVT